MADNYTEEELAENPRGGTPYRETTWDEFYLTFPRKKNGLPVIRVCAEGWSGKPVRPSWIQRLMRRWFV